MSVLKYDTKQSDGEASVMLEFWGLVCFSLVWFYGISTIIGYLMPNPFYTYKQFYFKKFGCANDCANKTVLILN